jgi:hypothetical protein
MISPLNPLIPAKAGTHFAGLRRLTVISNLPAPSALHEMGPGIRRDER